MAVDPRSRGYAIEDVHVEGLLEKQGFERTPDWWKTHDAFRGGTSRDIVEGGRTIRVVNRPDVVSVKSMDANGAAKLESKATEYLDSVRGPYEYSRGNLRIEGAAKRRLDLIFDLDVTVTPEMARTLDALKAKAGSVEFNWYVTRADKKIIHPGPEWMKKLKLTDLD